MKPPDNLIPGGKNEANGRALFLIEIAKANAPDTARAIIAKYVIRNAVG